MVVLTIVTEKNGETIYFEDPIAKVHFMKLIHRLVVYSTAGTL